MGFVEITEELLNKTMTENGDLAFKSTLSPCLDYFALAGGKRSFVAECASLFVKAFMEDKATALKLLFYTRDIKKGLGERRIFRFLFNGLCVAYPDLAKPLIKYIPEYGRYDDLLCTLETPAELVTLELIEKQLEEDVKNKKEGKPISLLAKWLPSINTSNADARAFALYLCDRLNISKAEYRKTLSFLRKGLIIENNLREKDYTFDYAHVPSMAMKKYTNAFRENDLDRYVEYLSAVKNGEAKMNVAVLDLVGFLVKLRKEMERHQEIDEEYFETAWKEVIRQAGKINKRVLVVRDGSGSMTWGSSNNCIPLDIADAMSLYTADRLTGEFHGKFITFSSSPELVDLSNLTTFKDKFLKLRSYDDCSNTDIQKVYELILNVYKSPKFKDEDALDQILIISDMQFDQCTYGENDKLISTFEYFKGEFAKLNHKMPEIVFWNVESRNINVPVSQHETGVKLISGSSKNVVDLVVENSSLDPIEFMNKVLKRYDFIDEILKGKL